MRKSLFLKSLFIIFFIWVFLISCAEANVILKVVSVNPSKEYPQKAQVKLYLPKEAKPEDVIDKGDLDISYDTQQGCYFVHGESELKPGEMLERSIELRDIWFISNTEIESLRAEALKTSGLLKNTEFAERSAFLLNSIESKLNQLMENQRVAPPNPERHISDYRENLKILDSVKADLAIVRSFLAQSKPLPALMIWKVIVAIVIFMGFVGLAFSFIWQKQLKVISEESTFYVPPADKAQASNTSEGPIERGGDEASGKKVSEEEKGEGK
jgi:hypothetical protein